MEAYNTSFYPIFEADQVISPEEINNLVSHLEEQNRISRKNLTGLGIVSGLELSFPTQTTVKISCGTAVTSLGFQINLDEIVLSNFHNYELSEHFLKPDNLNVHHSVNIFKHTIHYESIKNCVELLPSNSDVANKKAIPVDFFIGKSILLLLEVALIDKNNGITSNSIDKGKRIEFNIRPLLIPINEFTEHLTPKNRSLVDYAKISLPRFNVPYKNIITDADLLLGFKKVYDSNFLIGITTSINALYQDFKSLLPNDSKFGILKEAKLIIDKKVDFYKSGPNVQYLWDWISDITQAYNEIIEFPKINPTFSCVDNTFFPFHVVLGNSEEDSNQYRTPTFNSSNSTNEEQLKLQKLILLFERLADIIKSFGIVNNSKIKVTPSIYGNVPLSEKSIPFYYEEVLNINKKWNPELTLKKQNDTILAYHSDLTNYTDKIHVQSPLLYDIEKYNFFRIEGHLGKKYKTVIKELNLIKECYSLPFEIIAVNAVNHIDKDVDISQFEGRWDDLETDYDLARKRLFNITEFVINWMDLKKSKLIDNNIITLESINNFKDILIQIKDLLTNDLKEFLPNFTGFIEIFKELNQVFLFHRFCLQLNISPNSDKYALVEDLIDRLDDINELFLEDPFTVIFEEANLRWQNTFKDLFFSTFLKKHPGIEHKAGVTKGGTFVLVYSDNSIFTPPTPPPAQTSLLTSITTYAKNINIDSTIKQNLINSIKFKDFKSQVNVKPNNSSINKFKAETDTIKADLLEVAKFNLLGNYTVDMSNFILENLKEALRYDDSISSQPFPFQQIIIADFFLPYLCRGAGNPIELKIELNEPLSISLVKLNFCNNDSAIYDIEIKGKTGGVFSGDGSIGIALNGGKYFFEPSRFSISTTKTFTLTYEVDGETSNTIELQISSPTDLKWKVVRDKTQKDKFIFTNPIPNDLHNYEFYFGDNTEKLTTSGGSVSHIFKFNDATSKFNVIISQLGEVCENKQIITVENVIGDFSAGDFNSNDFNT